MTRSMFRLGEAASAGYDVDVDAETAGWNFSAFQRAALGAGESLTRIGTEYEYIVVPLSGSYEVRVSGEVHTLKGRSGVFAGSTDVLYIPRDTDAVITALTDGRVSFPAAKARTKLAVQYLAAEDVPIGIRGSGNMSRRAREFCMAGGVKSDRLLALEVITPGGNWSGYPPHKHDTNSDHPEGELNLEELYYFEVSDGPAGDPGFAYQRVFSADERPLDEFAEVHTGDVMVIPFGWHGPSIAPPGYDMYYLNVMAGDTDERAWRFSNEPRAEWLRDTWETMPVDPRVLDAP